MCIYIIGTIWGVCNLRIIRGMGFVCFWVKKPAYMKPRIIRRDPSRKTIIHRGFIIEHMLI